MASEEEIGNKIEHHNELGYFMNVYDFRPETLEFMENNDLQGGGPTWEGLIQAALEIRSPSTLSTIEFDEEADMALVTSEVKESMDIVKSLVSLIMSDSTFRQQCIEHAQAGGYLE